MCGEDDEGKGGGEESGPQGVVGGRDKDRARERALSKF